MPEFRHHSFIFTIQTALPYYFFISEALKSFWSIILKVFLTKPTPHITN